MASKPRGKTGAGKRGATSERVKKTGSRTKKAESSKAVSSAQAVPAERAESAPRSDHGESGDAIGRIIQGDCIEQLGRLEAGSVDLAFADPPFNIGYDYDEYDDKRSSGDYLSWSKKWMKGVVRVLKPDGTFWLAIGDEYAAELKVMATSKLGLICRSWVVWYYTFGVHCKYKFTRSHAHIFYFVKDAKNFTFNDSAVRVPSARQLVYGDKRANPKGRLPDDTWIVPPAPDGQSDQTHRPRSSFPYALSKNPANHPTVTHEGWILRPQDLPQAFNAHSDTWYFSRVCGTFKEREGFHGCQMPERLLGRIISACSNAGDDPADDGSSAGDATAQGDLVLDPFAGSGTTLAAAKKLGRRYVGIELSKQYAAACERRLERINVGAPLDGVENPLLSAPDTRNGVVRTADGRRIKRNGGKTASRAKGNVQRELWL